MSADSEKADELNAKQTAVLALLIGGVSVDQAAETTGVGERTIRRWLAEHEAFKRELRTRQRQAMECTTRDLQAAATDAVRTLKTVMNDAAAPHGARVSAAKAALDTAYRAFETDELAQRIEELEAELPGKGRAGRKP